MHGFSSEMACYLDSLRDPERSCCRCACRRASSPPATITIIPAADLVAAGANPLLRVSRCEQGGHCGFLTGLYANAYCDEFTLEQFEALPDL